MVQLFYIFIFSHSHTPFIVVVISVLYIFTFSSRARWALRSTATKCVRGGLQRATKRLNWLLEAVNRWLDAYSPIEPHQMCLVPPLCIAVILIHYIASPGTSCVALTWYWRDTDVRRSVTGQRARNRAKSVLDLRDDGDALWRANNVTDALWSPLGLPARRQAWTGAAVSP